MQMLCNTHGLVEIEKIWYQGNNSLHKIERLLFKHEITYRVPESKRPNKYGRHIYACSICFEARNGSKPTVKLS